MEAIEFNLVGKQLQVFGLDEVGRGPLAGPVVSCCCGFSGKKSDLLEAINLTQELGVGDSKKLSEKKRKKILESLNIDVSQINFGKVYKFKIGKGVFSFSLCEIDHKEIDKINILQASLKSMDKAFIQAAKNSPMTKNSKIWVDGNKLPHKIKDFPGAEAIVKGDSKSFIIALASIIAKEKRDHLMKDFSLKYPEYGFEKHAGYPTQNHKEAIKQFGPCPIHRLSFKGVR